jgi:hypothetical protein
VTTSTRLTSSCGNWLTSVTPVTLAGTTRWPSSRVSVRIGPRPRRLKRTQALDAAAGAADAGGAAGAALQGRQFDDGVEQVRLRGLGQVFGVQAAWSASAG